MTLGRAMLPAGVLRPGRVGTLFVPTRGMTPLPMMDEPDACSSHHEMAIIAVKDHGSHASLPSRPHCRSYLLLYADGDIMMVGE